MSQYLHTGDRNIQLQRSQVQDYSHLKKKNKSRKKKGKNLCKVMHDPAILRLAACVSAKGFLMEERFSSPHLHGCCSVHSLTSPSAFPQPCKTPAHLVLTLGKVTASTGEKRKKGDLVIFPHFICPPFS